jgi:lipopolysaccharide export system permease protein
MKVLDRYIFRTVASNTLIALLVLLLLEFCLSLLVELEDVGRANYNFGAALRYLLLIQPQRLYEIFPMALLLGCLLGMGNLASNGELTVMRTAGLSLMRLTGSASQAGMLLSLAVLLIGEFVAPPLDQLAREQRSTDKSEDQTINGGSGFWARDGDYFIHIRSVLPGFRLVDIHTFKVSSEAQLESVTSAQNAYFRDGHWILEGIKRSILNSASVQTEYLDDLSIASVISPRILKVLAISPGDLSIRDLWIYIDYLEHNGLDAHAYLLVLWRKISASLVYIAMLVVAMPFVFSPHRAAGTGQRLLIGLLIGLLFFLLNYIIGNLELLYSFTPPLGAVLTPLFFLLFGLFSLYRLR